jgi:hypothetical protein
MLSSAACRYKCICAILFLSLFAFCFKAYAQFGEVCGIMEPRDSTNWGIGVIKWKQDSSIEVYNDKTKAVIVIGGPGSILFERADILHAEHYGNVFLKVFETKGTACKVLVNTINGGLWIDFRELKSKGMAFHTYASILFNSNSGTLGVNLFKSCLNLRAGPSKDSKLIKCISRNVNDNAFHKIKIQHHKDDWAFIVVQECVADPNNEDFGEGCGYKVQNEIRGWVKAIDDKGYPNLWFSLTKN